MAYCSCFSDHVCYDCRQRAARLKAAEDELRIAQAEAAAALYRPRTIPVPRPVYVPVSVPRHNDDLVDLGIAALGTGLGALALGKGIGAIVEAFSDSDSKPTRKGRK